MIATGSKATAPNNNHSQIGKSNQIEVHNTQKGRITNAQLSQIDKPTQIQGCETAIPDTVASN